MTEPQHDTETLRGLIARELTGARQRTALLTDCVDDTDLARQHSPLMSPLVWDLAHIANQEELWLLREVGGREPMHPEIDPLYDAFEHPRAERPTLPLLPPAQARAYGHEVRGRVLDLLDRAPFSVLEHGALEHGALEHGPSGPSSTGPSSTGPSSTGPSSTGVPGCSATGSRSG